MRKFRDVICIHRAHPTPTYPPKRSDVRMVLDGLRARRGAGFGLIHDRYMTGKHCSNTLCKVLPKVTHLVYYVRLPVLDSATITVCMDGYLLVSMYCGRWMTVYRYLGMGCCVSVLSILFPLSFLAVLVYTIYFYRYNYSIFQLLIFCDYYFYVGR